MSEGEEPLSGEPASEESPAEESELIRHRRENLEAIVALGEAPYPTRCPVSATVTEIVQEYGARDSAALEATAPEVATAGRVRALRLHGKAGFFDLHDGTTRIQVYVRQDSAGERAFALYRHLDLGDWVAVEGAVFRTRTGELTIKARRLQFLAKALRPLPEKWHGLRDVERRYRQRYLDLAVNPEARKVFEVRARLVAALRRFLDAHQYVEVETPMMQPIASGAAARPFVTHHNALDMTLYLRIAPELYLKRLVVGGMARVYEINRNFRNEGISTQHNPEFTMLEFYQAYGDYRELIDLTEEMLNGVAREVGGGEKTKWGSRTIEWTRPFSRYTMLEAIERFAARAGHEIPLAHLRDRRHTAELAARFLGPALGKAIWGKQVAGLFEHFVEAQLEQPTFITEFPTDISPLSKQKPEDPELAERFELYIGGMEVANGFSELNDPAEQERRFRQQAEERDKGDDEAMAYDEDYITALEYGMPPTAGEGIGIDRLVMLLADRPSIRDVILFPLMRPRKD
jgi:lysyl-tRNA synthetase, class II